MSPDDSVVNHMGRIFFLITEQKHKQTKILGNRCELNELWELDPGEDRTIKYLVAGL